MFQIKIAGLVIGIQHNYNFVSRLCEEYKVEGEPEDFWVSATKEEILTEQAQDEAQYPLSYCESLCLYRNLCLKLIVYDSFLMHSAALELDGEAYVFAAKSGVGKTTHLKLWMEEFGERVHVINGDKPVYRFLDGRLYACGTPWCGKESLGSNRMAPVKAVFFLERSPENEVCPLDCGEVIGRIFHQLLMPKQEPAVSKFLELIDRTLSAVSFYLLKCNRNREAAKTAYQGCAGQTESTTPQE